MSLILQASQIKKQYSTRTILDFESFSVYEGDRIGIVGQNGAGKTTLLEILCKKIAPDKGAVNCSRNIAYIRQFEQNDDKLSGGENVKKRILRESGREDTVIFADEPTANLDKDGIKWVRSKLLSADTVLLISHDRSLLDDVCNRIVEIKDGKLNFFAGNYSDYIRELETQRRRQLIEYEEYIDKKEQLKSAIQVKEAKVARQKKKKKQEMKKNSSEARLGGHKRTASHKKQERDAQVLKNRLEKMPEAQRPGKLPQFRINFDLTNPPKGKYAVNCDDLCFSYGDRLIFDHAAFSIPTNSKIAITGKNGAGKTTLLNLISEKNPQIVLAPKLKPGYLHQDFSNISPDKTVLENALKNSVQDRASVFSILSGLLFFAGDFEKKAGILSGGEKIRLSLAMLIASDCNALMLDEPTNYLDIRSIEAIESVIRQYPGTVIIVSHDETFLAKTIDRQLLVQDGRITFQ